MADFFVTLECSATAQPTVVRLVQIVRSRAAVATSSIVKLPQLTRRATGTGTPTMVKALTRAFVSSASSVITAIYNAIRPKTYPTGILDSKWLYTLDIDSFAEIDDKYTGTLEGPILDG